MAQPTGMRTQWPPETARLIRLLEHLAPQKGLFVVGVADPSDMWLPERQERVNLLDCDDFYTHWRRRLTNVRRLGTPQDTLWVRIGEGYSQVHIGPGRYNWELLDKIVPEVFSLGMVPIVDMIHFGLPTWLHEPCPETPFFQNPDYPCAIAEYAAAFARRYPQVRFYDLFNEPYPTTEWSTLFGWFNEGRRDRQAFVRALKHNAQAVSLMRRAITDVWVQERRPDEPLFLVNESMGKGFAVAGGEGGAAVAEFNDVMRFLPLRLMLGVHDARAEAFLSTYGLTSSEYSDLMAAGSTPA